MLEQSENIEALSKFGNIQNEMYLSKFIIFLLNT